MSFGDVSTSVLINDGIVYAVRMSCVSNGNNEVNVAKIDRSALQNTLGQVPDTLPIESIQWTIQGYQSVRLLWDRDPKLVADIMSNTGLRDYAGIGFLPDTGSGGTGDILLTTTGAESGATYDIVLVVRVSPDDWVPVDDGQSTVWSSVGSGAGSWSSVNDSQSPAWAPV